MKRTFAIALIVMPLAACNPWDYIPVRQADVLGDPPATEAQTVSTTTTFEVEPEAAPTTFEVEPEVTVHHEITCGEGDTVVTTDVGTVPAWEALGCRLTGRVFHANPE